MSQPNLNSQGQQVWNPSVGAYFSPGKENAESFGGIVTAIQDQLESSGSLVKAYPYTVASIPYSAGPAQLVKATVGFYYEYSDLLTSAKPAI